jgi:hypothetical protein
MERWSGVLRVPLHSNSGTFHRVGASLCLSSETRNLSVSLFSFKLNPKAYSLRNNFISLYAKMEQFSSFKL